MAGTISQTTPVFIMPIQDFPEPMLTQATDFIKFAQANGVADSCYGATFTTIPVQGLATRYHLVYEKPGRSPADRIFGIDMNVQAEGPQTANADCRALRAFYEIEPADELAIVWNDFAAPQVPQASTDNPRPVPALRDDGVSDGEINPYVKEHVEKARE